MTFHPQATGTYKLTAQKASVKPFSVSIPKTVNLSAHLTMDSQEWRLKSLAWALVDKPI